MTNLNDVKVGGKPISEWTIEDHNRALNDLGAHIYKPLDGVLVLGAGSTPYMLKVRMTTGDGREEEREIVDALACYSAVPFGHSDRVMVEGIQDFIGRMATIPRSISHEYLGPWLVALKEYTGYDMFLPKSSGTEANEAAIKAIRKWGRRYGGKDGKGIKPPDIPVIISAKNSFHGRGFGSTTLMTDEVSKQDVGPLLPGVDHVPFNDVDAIEAKIGEHAGSVAAIFLEPIQAEAGIFIPDDDYLKKVQQLAKENNILFVLDEVQTGFGRCGTDFAWQLYGLEMPDLLTLGKAMSAGFLPISCLCGKKEIMELFVPHSEGSTFGGFPLAAYVGMLTLSELKRRKITRMASEKGKYMRGRLDEVARKYPEKVKEVRGKGLLFGLEIHPQYDGHDLSAGMLRHGVYAKETHCTNLRLAPPIIIDEEGMNTIVAALDETLAGMEARNPACAPEPGYP
ncbi:MAG: aminotransferase class III-fold pyridoxal phosphate-dependent enzyme [bacterium]|jgi:ornithine--oxo-acid transaminase